MPRVRSELTEDALEDLNRYAASGNLKQFLKKLVRLEEEGPDVGRPLGQGLVNFRKIVVGDRDWRIIFSMNEDDTVATVWVIGDRADAECYEEAARRLQDAKTRRSEMTPLSTVLLRLLTEQAEKKRKRRKT
jgi:mRNA interferase RelE/StbE